MRIMAKPQNAYEELIAELHPDEIVEAIVFGAWEGEMWGDLAKPPVSNTHQCHIMTLKEAEPIMQNWHLNTGFGGADCYATYVWTNQRVFWVHEYDGSTGLRSMPRNPVHCKPVMSGE